MTGQAPLRISFFGGGTDSPEFVERYGPGLVLATAINRYVRCSGVGQLGYDVEPGTGLGASSAAWVLRSATHPCSRPALVRAAWESERTEAPSVGWQDHVMAVHGGFHLVRFEAAAYSLTPVPTGRIPELQDHLLLLDTGGRRRGETAKAAMNAAIGKRRGCMLMMRDFARQGFELLACDGHLRAFGNLLWHAWNCKRSLAPAQISSPAIDAMEEAGRHAGAWGVKLLGAGGGGFLLFVVPPDRREAVKAATGLAELHIRINAPGLIAI